MPPEVPQHELANWRDFPAAAWRWPNFTPQEMACKGDGRLLIHAESLDLLQNLRNLLAAPLVIHSAYRTRDYNKRVGGAPGSMHLAARAYDVSMSGHDPHEFETAARHCGFTGFGFYPDQNFMHIDTGGARWWGDPFPAYQDEPHPAPAPVANIGALAPGHPVTAELAEAIGGALYGKTGSTLKNKRRAG